MNINILNKLLKRITDQIPLVNSFYTDSPYNSWNMKEVKYGSVSFVVTKVDTREQTSAYEAVLYYADRLTEDKSNRDSIHSDASTVIQTIVGAINQCDDLYLTVDYPVNITLFEQSFSDELCGGYANLRINTVGMGECFEDELKVPEIVATSAYYTKEEIAELFTTKTEFYGFVQAQNDINVNFAVELRNKVNSSYIAELRKSLDDELDDKIDRQTFDNYIVNAENVINGLEQEVNTKASSEEFREFSASVENRFGAMPNLEQIISDLRSLNVELDERPTRTQFDALYEAIAVNLVNLAAEVKDKVNNDEYQLFRNRAEIDINNRVTLQNYNQAITDLNGKVKGLEDGLTLKLDDSVFQGWKECIMRELEERVTNQMFSNFAENVYTKQEIEDRFFNYETVIYNFLNSEEIRLYITSQVDKIIGDYIGIDLTDYYTKGEIDDLLKTLEVDVDLSAYYTKTEIDDLLDNIETGDVNLDDYYTKEESTSIFCTNSGLNTKLSSYYKKTETYSKSEINKQLTDLEESNDVRMEDYYTKLQVDDLLDNIETGDVNMDNYYTKTEIDSTIGNINNILNNVLYTY